MKKFAKIMTPVLSGVLAVGVLAACSTGSAAPNPKDGFGTRIVRENKGSPGKGESKHETADVSLEPGDRGGVDDADKPGNGPKSKGDDIAGNGKGQYDHKPGRDRDDRPDKNRGEDENTGDRPDRNTDNRPNLNNKHDKDRDSNGNFEHGERGGRNPRHPRGGGDAPDRNRDGFHNNPQRENRHNCCSQCGDNNQERPDVNAPGRPNNPPGMDRGNAPFDKAEHRERGGRPNFNNKDGKGKGKP